ncbi:MAG: DUF72 domain-containing protein [Candidatus Ozemobacteraceae bacterium]
MNISNDIIRVGTCSWTDPSLISCGRFYPPAFARSAEGRLRFYSDRFSTVEVDASYYAIPPVKTVQAWVDRTPPGFTFHLKIFGALTGHAIKPASLPKAFRDELSQADRNSPTLLIRQPELLARLAATFRSAVEPLRASGKLGLIVFQFSPRFSYSAERLNFLETLHSWIAPLPMAIEFRHASWVEDPSILDRVVGKLNELGLPYVTADEPRFASPLTIPFKPAVTGDIAFFRLHGRNRENWFKKDIQTSLRYNYLYNDEELADFVSAAREASRRARLVFLMFNNCHEDAAIKNALRTLELLQAAGE